MVAQVLFCQKFQQAAVALWTLRHNIFKPMRRSWLSCLKFFLFGILFVGFKLKASAADDTYPMNSIKCIATLAKGVDSSDSRKIICPQDRQGGCEKNELTTIPPELCGRGLYFGFEVDQNGKCVWRRCSLRTPASVKGQSAIPAEYLYENEVNLYQWERHVCSDEDYCNATSIISMNISVVFSGVVILLCLLLYPLWQTSVTSWGEIIK